MPEVAVHMTNMSWSQMVHPSWGSALSPSLPAGSSCPAQRGGPAGLGPNLQACVFAVGSLATNALCKQACSFCSAGRALPWGFPLQGSFLTQHRSVLFPLGPPCSHEGVNPALRSWSQTLPSGTPVLIITNSSSAPWLHPAVFVHLQPYQQLSISHTEPTVTKSLHSAHKHQQVGSFIPCSSHTLQASMRCLRKGCCTSLPLLHPTCCSSAPAHHSPADKHGRHPHLAPLSCSKIKYLKISLKRALHSQVSWTRPVRQQQSMPVHRAHWKCRTHAFTNYLFLLLYKQTKPPEWFHKHTHLLFKYGRLQWQNWAEQVFCPGGKFEKLSVDSNAQEKGSGCDNSLNLCLLHLSQSSSQTYPIKESTQS